MAPKKRPPIERFMEKVHVLQNGCWKWTAYVGDNGYGRFYLDGKGLLAHRWAYEFHKGKIEEGLVIDHLCRERACVNPDHLEPVAQSANVLRGVGPVIAAERCRAITRCPQGHSYTEENTYRGGRGRTCVECKRANARAYYERNREVVIARSAKWRRAQDERTTAV